jgi:hypothetical protein
MLDDPVALGIRPVECERPLQSLFAANPEVVES